MLTLPITDKWFRMILSGVKMEEYRDITRYYTSRFINLFGRRDMYTPMPDGNTNVISIPAENVRREIIFRNGYSNGRPSFTADCSLSVGFGKEEWGAQPGTKYYILHIHSITDRRKC